MPAQLAREIAPHLPYLRRYARALSGSQSSGDAYVTACLEAIVADPSIFDAGRGARIGLYGLFHRLWNSTQTEPSGAGEEQSIFERTAQARLSSMTPESRQILLLTTLEGFSMREAAAIADLHEEQARSLIDAAIAEIDRQMATQVLIIEDEPIISIDLAEIVEGLGHSVTKIARTAGEAVRAAKADRPGLVLADIQLADNSSGIEAVREILDDFEVPVIFITSFPERLLTGERPEPTFLITKPYDPNTVKAGISQALFFNSTAPVPS
jgi:DNA-directed RNA polymerase specialized sigma24 family protein/CheY-like chemotaxis protein